MMSEKERFVVSTNLVGEIIVTDTETGNVYHYGSMSNFLGLIRLMNEQQTLINKQNELIELIANACTYSKEHSVKEILRKEIKGIDTVTYESANAWHDYVLLSEFFEKHYKEYWDNE